MPDIKVKDVTKGTVKAIDKSATAAQRMKNAYIRTKEKAEHSAAPQEGSPEEYAAGRVSSGLDSAQKAVREFDRQGRKGVKTTKENISKAKDFFEKRAVNQPKKQARRKAAESIRRTTGNAKKTIKTVDRGKPQSAPPRPRSRPPNRRQRQRRKQRRLPHGRQGLRLMPPALPLKLRQLQQRLLPRQSRWR